MERLKKIGALERLSSSEIEYSKIGIGFEKLDRDVFDPEKASDKVAAIGVKKVRIQSGWLKTERERGVYDFEWLDKIVDNLIARGMEPWICLCYGNPLYTEFAGRIFGAVKCPPMGEDARQGWVNYVTAITEHFKGRIKLWEIWNEPELGWKHYFEETKADYDLLQNAREYAEFSIDTSKAIKAVDPDAKIAGFALAHTRAPYFVNTALRAGIGDYIDYISFHLYSAADWQREDVIRALRSLVDMYDPSIGLIQGEGGAQSRSDGNGAVKGFAWTPEKQMTILLRTLVTDLWCGVEFTSYFSTMDMIEALNGVVGDKSTYLDFGYFGVLGADFDEDGVATGEYTPKPSYFALQALATLFKGNVKRANIPYYRAYNPSRRINATEEDEQAKIYGFELDDGSHALVYWNATPVLTTTYEGTISFALCGQKPEDISLCDLRDGTIYTLRDDMIEDAGEDIVRLKNLPLLDVPLAILMK